MLTPSERVEKMLRKEPVDRIPFTVYENKMTICRTERELRNDGLCIIQRHPNFYHISTPKCRREVRHVCENGRRIVRTTLETAKGTVTSSDVQEGSGSGMWRNGCFFSGEKDYVVLKAYVEDHTYVADYEVIRQKIAESGGGVTRWLRSPVADGGREDGFVGGRRRAVVVDRTEASGR